MTSSIKRIQAVGLRSSVLSVCAGTNQKCLPVTFWRLLRRPHAISRGMTGAPRYVIAVPPHFIIYRLWYLQQVLEQIPHAYRRYACKGLWYLSHFQEGSHTESTILPSTGIGASQPAPYPAGGACAPLP